MGLNLEYIDGQTPLSEEEKDGLKIKTINTKGELDEFEQKNIEEAIQWTLTQKWSKETILSEKFVKSLHVKMFGNIWNWAGSFRKTNKNIGVDKWEISVELSKLLADAIYWIENETYDEDEIAIRFKHKLVCIHCFPNGNGRHSRLMADILRQQVFEKSYFSWGHSNLVNSGDSRKDYIDALKKADGGNFSELITFARS